MTPCPICGVPCDVSKQEGLLAAERAWHSVRPSNLNSMQLLASEGWANWYWACDACLGSGRAIQAQPDVVEIGMGTAYAAYVPRPFKCRDCTAQAVFTPEEQQHWYEELGFFIWSHAVRCKPCRTKRQTTRNLNTALQQALACLNPKNPDQVEAVAELYAKMGSKKADEWRGRAANLRKRVVP